MTVIQHLKMGAVLPVKLNHVGMEPSKQVLVRNVKMEILFQEMAVVRYVRLSSAEMVPNKLV